MNTRLLRFFAIPMLFALFLSACEVTEYGGSSFDGSSVDNGGDDGQRPADDSLLVNAGKSDYDAQCAFCHGALGEGGAGGPINPDNFSLDELTTYNDTSMPPGDGATSCAGDCASEVSKYIMAGFKEISADDVGGGDSGGGLVDLTNQGQASYDQYCLSCHGTQGDGIYPIDATRFNLAEMNEYNDTQMPPANPADCTGVCASEVSKFILAGYNEVSAAPPPAGDGGGSNDGGNNGGVVVVDAQARQLYNDNCAGCHGEQGDGNPALGGGPLKGADCVACSDQGTLSSTIASSMPLGNPTACEGQCSDKTAAYILADFLLDGESPGAGQPPVPDPGGAPTPTPDPGVSDSNFIADAQSKAEYDRQCANCHGEQGNGAFPLSAPYSSLIDLYEINEDTMPQGSAGSCSGECAERVSAYIWAGFQVTDEVFTP